MSKNFALISIKPQYARKIILGEKIYEFRRRAPKALPLNLFIYSTSPDKSIIGIGTVNEIIEDDLTSLWNRCSAGAGIDKELFMEYFNGLNRGNALIIEKITVFDKPINPKDIFDDFAPPQSYYYLDEIDASLLLSKGECSKSMYPAD